MIFTEKLTAAIKKNNSLLCVGLDPDPAKMPVGLDIFDFNKAIINATADLVCAYKPNFAFYEAAGMNGITALKKTIEFIPKHIPVISDAKRGDIGNTSKAYAEAIFNEFKCDAVTVSPYLGFDSIEPFINFKDKFSFILCRTSNPGAADFQSLSVNLPGKPAQPLYQLVAEKAAAWNKFGNIGLVVGATYSEELAILRKSRPDMVFLIPGVGAQGADVAETVRAGINSQKEGAIINSSRQIIYASREKDFAVSARKTAEALRGEINRHRV